MKFFTGISNQLIEFVLRAIGPNSARLHEIAREVISIEDESGRMQEAGVKKLVAAGIVYAWIITMPMEALMATIAYWLARGII